MGFQLHLFVPGETTPAASQPGSAWTLSQFFHRWYWPQRLEEFTELDFDQARQQRPKTKLVYADLLRWWAALTGDPPLEQLDAALVKRFRQALAAARYRRGPHAPERRLAIATQRKLLAALRALLGRLGETGPGRRPAAHVLVDPPSLRLAPVACLPRRPFSPSEARAIFAAAGRTKLPPGPQFWQLLLGLLYFTGRRIGEALALDWSHLRPYGPDLWALCPPPAITKTRLTEAIWLAPQLVELLRLRGGAISAAGPLLAAEVSPRWLSDLHRHLQRDAGLDPAARQGWHAWRRTHAVELQRLGLANLDELARAALGHASSSTTRAHYTDAANSLRLRLPRLDLPATQEDGSREQSTPPRLGAARGAGPPTWS